MLAAGRKTVNTKLPGRSGPDLVLRFLLPLVLLIGGLSVGIAFRDAARRQERAADVAARLEKVREWNRRVEELIERLPRDPATRERWLRERDRLLPGEEVVGAR